MISSFPFPFQPSVHFTFPFNYNVMYCNVKSLCKGFSRHVGQLPIMFVDDFELTQVHACVRYIARRYGFNGNTEKEAARADEATELIYDLRLCKKIGDLIFFHHIRGKCHVILSCLCTGLVAYKESFTPAHPDIVRHTG